MGSSSTIARLSISPAITVSSRAPGQSLYGFALLKRIVPGRRQRGQLIGWSQSKLAETEDALKKMRNSMELSAKHIELLERLAEKQRVTYGGVPDGCDDLEHAGYVTTTAVNSAEILTAITDLGRRALAEVKGQSSGERLSVA